MCVLDKKLTLYLQERKEADEILPRWVVRLRVKPRDNERGSQVYCCKGRGENKYELCLREAGLAACMEGGL